MQAAEYWAQAYYAINQQCGMMHGEIGARDEQIDTLESELATRDARIKELEAELRESRLSTELYRTKRDYAVTKQRNADRMVGPLKMQCDSMSRRLAAVTEELEAAKRAAAEELEAAKRAAAEELEAAKRAAAEELEAARRLYVDELETAVRQTERAVSELTATKRAHAEALEKHEKQDQMLYDRLDMATKSEARARTELDAAELATRRAQAMTEQTRRELAQARDRIKELSNKKSKRETTADKQIKAACQAMDSQVECYDYTVIAAHAAMLYLGSRMSLFITRLDEMETRLRAMGVEIPDREDVLKLTAYDTVLAQTQVEYVDTISKMDHIPDARLKARKHAMIACINLGNIFSKMQIVGPNNPAEMAAIAARISLN